MNIAEVHAESRTRDRVRRAVGLEGPITASSLAKDLGLTAAAVRRHLDALEEAGLIVEHEQPGVRKRGRGRPARAYVLTPLGHEQFRTAYDGVATAALHFLSETAGEEAIEEFATAQIAQLEVRLQKMVDAQIEAAGGPDAVDLETRASALAAALSAEGFAATSRPVGQGTGLAGIQLCQGHCPIRTVATEFRHFCDAETEAISRILGAHVQRLATLAGGEHVCTTFVPTGALEPGAPAPDPHLDSVHAPPHVIPRTSTTDHTADERSKR